METTDRHSGDQPCKCGMKLDLKIPKKDIRLSDIFLGTFIDNPEGFQIPMLQNAMFSDSHHHEARSAFTSLGVKLAQTSKSL